MKACIIYSLITALFVFKLHSVSAFPIPTSDTPITQTGTAAKQPSESVQGVDNIILTSRSDTLTPAASRSSVPKDLCQNPREASNPVCDPYNAAGSFQSYNSPGSGFYPENQQNKASESSSALSNNRETQMQKRATPDRMRA
ncbi:hypothetical protein BGZ76_006644 [Entomortierella beljakovae]|nr:hypothetical protein BGZ76_006644 [Entomortierella beljakovae]